ncbi:IL12A protein, partial [Poecile atricapillus]|nr:IL12A protein [Poecile atricapillus]
QELGTLGFECSPEEVEVEDITQNQTNTIRACTAQAAEVRETQITPQIQPQELAFIIINIIIYIYGKCLQGISEDLRAYRTELRNLQDPQLLLALDGMMEVRIP